MTGSASDDVPPSLQNDMSTQPTDPSLSQDASTATGFTDSLHAYPTTMPAEAYPLPPHLHDGFASPPGGYPYGIQQGIEARFSVGDALSWSWNKFAKNALPLVLTTLCYLLMLSAMSWGFYKLAIEVSPDRTFTQIGDKVLIGVSFSRFGLGMLALRVIALIAVGAVVLSAFYSGLLAIANGYSTAIGSFFKTRYVVRMIVLTFIVGVTVGAGYILCVIPGILVSLFAMFSHAALLDRGLRPIDAIKFSVNITKDHFGSALLIWLLSVALLVVGLLLAGVGLLVSGPVVGLLHVYTYRRLSGATIAPQTL